jgi:membrane protease YdiL (CAAX protease family)
MTRASPRSAVFGWVTIVVGLATAAGAIKGSEALGSIVTVDSLAAANVLFYTLLFAPLIVLSLVLGAIDRRPVLRAGSAPGRWGLLGLVTGAGGLATCVLYVWLHGTLRPEDNPAVPQDFIALGLGIALMGVLAEEMLFRGWLQPALGDRVGPSLAVLLSAVAFSAFHLWAGGATDAISLANLMLGGLWFGLLAQRSGGLVAPVAAHLGWNVAEDIGFGLVPNPGVGELGALSNHQIVGGATWGGSAEGLNASIAMTLVLLALVIPLLPAFATRVARRESLPRG